MYTCMRLYPHLTTYPPNTENETEIFIECFCMGNDRLQQNSKAKRQQHCNKNSNSKKFQTLLLTKASEIRSTVWKDAFNTASKARTRKCRRAEVSKTKRCQPIWYLCTLQEFNHMQKSYAHKYGGYHQPHACVACKICWKKIFWIFDRHAECWHANTLNNGNTQPQRFALI